MSSLVFLFSSCITFYLMCVFVVYLCVLFLPIDLSTTTTTTTTTRVDIFTVQYIEG